MDKMSQSNFYCNEAFMLIKGIAYNLLNWFRQALLAEPDCHWEIPTIRRNILTIPGNIVGNGSYRPVKLAPKQ